MSTLIAGRLYSKYCTYSHTLYLLAIECVKSVHTLRISLHLPTLSYPNHLNLIIQIAYIFLSLFHITFFTFVCTLSVRFHQLGPLPAVAAPRLDYNWHLPLEAVITITASYLGCGVHDHQTNVMSASEAHSLGMLAFFTSPATIV